MLEGPIAHSFRVLFQDPSFVAIDKPSGFHVHPPEDTRRSIPGSRNTLKLLGTQLGLYLYPVHRLDAATSGILIYALEASAAGRLAAAFRDRTVHKTYYAVVRGWTEDRGEIDRPLRSERDEPLPSLTRYETLGRIELPHAIGRYPTTRYSLVRARPETGRMHQIRRHFAGLSHPLLGDTIYGDGAHNRFFRETLKLPGLLLRAHALDLAHPATGAPLRLHARWRRQWLQIFDRFGVCPFEG